jgi:membrane-associated HD superfamily phosphohydrolase
MDVVNKIIDGKINNHELEEAPLTFRDIKTIKRYSLKAEKTYTT